LKKHSPYYIKKPSEQDSELSIANQAIQEEDDEDKITLKESNKQKLDIP